MGAAASSSQPPPPRPAAANVAVAVSALANQGKPAADATLTGTQRAMVEVLRSRQKEGAREKAAETIQRSFRDKAGYSYDGDGDKPPPPKVRCQPVVKPEDVWRRTKLQVALTQRPKHEDLSAYVAE